MIKVNLVPPEILAKARQRQQMIQGAAIGVAALLLLLGMSVMHWAALSRLEGQFHELGLEFKRLEAVVAKVEEMDRTAGALRARLGVITDLLKGRPAYPKFMSDFVLAVPPGVTIKSLATTGGSTNPIKLTMAAESRSSQDIAAWVKNMEQSGKFTLIELGPVTSTEGPERTLNFTMTTTYTSKL
jgi:Tfp pilus assembly protein PilN